MYKHRYYLLALVGRCIVIVGISWPLNGIAAAQWQSSFSAEGMLYTGTVEMVTSTLRASVVRSDSLLRSELAGDFSYGEQSGVKVQQEGRGWLDLTLHPDNVVTPVGGGLAEFVKQRYVDLRWYAGVGARATILRDSLHQLGAGMTFVRDVTEYAAIVKLVAGTDIEQDWSLSIGIDGINHLTEFLSLSYEVISHHDVEDIDDYRIKAYLALSVPLAQVLNFTASITTNYENQPFIEEIEENDTNLQLGLQVKL